MTMYLRVVPDYHPLPGRRMVISILRVMGHSDDAKFSTYHRALNRAVWSSLGASHILLDLFIAAFAPDRPLVLAINETLERRRGKAITATGIERDLVRSSKGHFVKAQALRWISLMLLVPMPWAGRTWALPLLSTLASEVRYEQDHDRRRKAITDWARLVGEDDPRHDACPPRHILLHHCGGPRSLDPLGATCPDCGLVPYAGADLQGCDRPRAPLPVDGRVFTHPRPQTIG